MKNLFLILFLFFGLNSCSVFDPGEIEPGYIVVEDIMVYEPGNNSQVTTHDVRDIWAYLDGQALGVFPYPGHIPVIPANNGETSSLQFLAGIRDNGIASYLTLYPFLEFYELDQVILPGKTYKITPVYKYRSNVVMRFNEGFEHISNTFGFDLDKDPESMITQSAEKVRSGSYAAMLSVNKDHPILESANTTPLLNLPIDGKSIYIELDYLADQDFFFGMIGYDENTGSQGIKSYYLGMKENSDWQKVYINITEELSSSKFDAYRFFFSLQLDSDKENAKVYLDNVKLLHF